MAGINAALKIQGRLPLILTRDTSYIGTLIDDLVTKGTEEPYRIMTSRSEYRLLHRQDNADQRLTRIGGEIGLIPPERVQAVEEKYAQVRREVQRLEGSGIPASEELNAMLERKGTAPVANSARLADLLRRPQVSYADIAPFDPERPELSPAVTDEVEIQIKYAGYLTRQEGRGSPSPGKSGLRRHPRPAAGSAGKARRHTPGVHRSGGQNLRR